MSYSESDEESFIDDIPSDEEEGEGEKSEEEESLATDDESEKDEKSTFKLKKVQTFEEKYIEGDKRETNLFYPNLSKFEICRLITVMAKMIEDSEYEVPNSVPHKLISSIDIAEHLLFNKKYDFPLFIDRIITKPPTIFIERFKCRELNLPSDLNSSKNVKKYLGESLDRSAFGFVSRVFTSNGV